MTQLFVVTIESPVNLLKLVINLFKRLIHYSTIEFFQYLKTDNQIKVI